MKDPILRNQIYQDKSRPELRELYVKQILAYYKASGGLSMEEDQANSRKLTPFIGALWAINQGLAIRLSVHILLYADTINGLGTEKHRHYIDRAYRLKDYGSLSLTELGHGSNAAEIETTATYDHQTRTFVLHTPTSFAAKWWIGAAGKTANMTVVFAQLILNGTKQGVHVFLVPIRDYETHKALPGVILGDCGPKMGCDGIDNGFIIFENYRVPYDSLLDHFSHISEDGKLKSSIKAKEKRFAAMMAGMVRGRFGIISGSMLNLRKALTIAIRYAAQRTQFGPPNQPEIPILDYQITKYRLMPHIARLFAGYAGIELLRNLIDSIRPSLKANPESSESSHLHALLSVVKPLCSWYAQKGIQECRELLGGHGYSAFSGLGWLLTDNDVNSTWEGENNVLMQQTSRFIFKNVQRIIKGLKVESPYLSFVSIDPTLTDESPKFTSKEQLRDNLQLLKLIMEHRVSHLVRGSMVRMQENISKYGSALETWNSTQIYYLQPLAIAFGELVFTDELMKIAAIAKVQHPSIGELYSRITELYVLTTVAKDLGTFREQDYLSSVQGTIVRDYEVELCNELADSAVRMMDAVTVPEALLDSPFASREGNMYQEYIDLVEKAEGCYEPPTWVPLIKEVRKAL
jgi:acyl-CoA oxidase